MLDAQADEVIADPNDKPEEPLFVDSPPCRAGPLGLPVAEIYPISNPGGKS